MEDADAPRVRHMVATLTEALLPCRRTAHYKDSDHHNSMTIATRWRRDNMHFTSVLSRKAMRGRPEGHRAEGDPECLGSREPFNRRTGERREP